MTHYREPGSINDLLLKGISLLSPTEIKQATGKAYDTFSTISRPINDMGLHIDDGIELDKAFLRKGMAPIFFNYYASALEKLTRPKPSETDPAKAMMRVTGELGDVAKCINQAMEQHSEDGADLSINERREITKEIWEAKDQLDALLLIVEPPAILKESA